MYTAVWHSGINVLFFLLLRFSLFSSSFILTYQNLKVSCHLFLYWSWLSFSWFLFSLFFYWFFLISSFIIWFHLIFILNLVLIRLITIYFLILFLIEFFLSISSFNISIYFCQIRSSFFWLLFFLDPFLFIFCSVSSLNIWLIENFVSLFLRLSLYRVSPEHMTRLRVLRISLDWLWYFFYVFF